MDVSPTIHKGNRRKSLQFNTTSNTREPINAVKIISTQRFQILFASSPMARAMRALRNIAAITPNAAKTPYEGTAMGPIWKRRGCTVDCCR